MALSDPDLWRRLADFEVSPPGAVFSFAKRLARERRWSLGFAQQALGEYRRFLYLCMVARPPLTPSDAVDQVWHLHLAYPCSYRQELCRGVLGRPLRHEPAQCGAAGQVSSELTYRATLAAYEQEFGCPPPAAIWPAPDPPRESVSGVAAAPVEGRLPARRKPRRRVPAAPVAGQPSARRRPARPAPAAPLSAGASPA